MVTVAIPTKRMNMDHRNFIKMMRSRPTIIFVAISCGMVFLTLAMYSLSGTGSFTGQQARDLLNSLTLFKNEKKTVVFSGIENAEWCLGKTLTYELA